MFCEVLRSQWWASLNSVLFEEIERRAGQTIVLSGERPGLLVDSFIGVVAASHSHLNAALKFQQERRGARPLHSVEVPSAFAVPMLVPSP